MAFEVDEKTHNALPGIHDVYTYLPVRDFGFKFALQADFVLVSGRENIDESSDWNRELLNGIPAAFAKAVEVFNSSPLRYTWLLFLPDQLSKPFETAFWSIEQELKRRPILESETGTMAMPPNLKRVPKKFWLNGHPLLQIDAAQYLSVKYPDRCFGALESLGVPEISTYDFSEGLLKYIDGKETQEDYQAQKPEWHSRMAQICIQCSYVWKLRTSAVVPISEAAGTENSKGWVAAGYYPDNLFFPPTREDLIPPRGVGLQVIRKSVLKEYKGPNAEPDYRSNMFRELGAQDFDATKVWGFVEKEHSKPPSPNLLQLSLTDLISHVVFLFKTGWKNPDAIEIIVMTETEERVPANTVYFTPLEINGSEFPVLHQDYLASVSDAEKEGLRNWLLTELHVSRADAPRMVTALGDDFDLSPEMELISKTWSTSKYLILLRDHWDSNYSQWLKETSWETATFTKSRQRVRDKLAQSMVECQNGSKQLGETILRPIGGDYIHGNLPLPFLKTPDAKDTSWLFLQTFGVKKNVDLEGWFRCLDDLQATTPEEGSEQPSYKPLPKAKLASTVYTHIIDVCGNDRRKLRIVTEEFLEKPRIYIPARFTEMKLGPGLWVQSKDCMQNHPKYAELRHSFSLSTIYEYFPNSRLFENIGVDEYADFTRLRKDLDAEELWRGKAKRTPATLKYLLGLFDEFNNLHNGGHMGIQDLNKLRERPMFPVRYRSTDFEFLYTTGGDKEWYIADRVHLYDALCGEVPLLDFRVSQVENCLPLLKALGCTSRYLSNVVTARAVGTAHEDREYAGRLRRKARYIDSLIEDSPHDETALRPLIRNMEIRVYVSETMRVIWEVQMHRRVCRGKADRRRTIVTINGNVVEVYLAAEDVKSETGPVQLAEEISVLFDINPKHNHLIPYILSAENPEAVESYLIQKGIAVVPDASAAPNEAENASAAADTLQEQKSEQPREASLNGGVPKPDGDRSQDENIDGKTKTDERSKKDEQPKTDGQGKTDKKPKRDESPEASINPRSDASSHRGEGSDVLDPTQPEVNNSKAKPSNDQISETSDPPIKLPGSVVDKNQAATEGAVGRDSKSPESPINKTRPPPPATSVAQDAVERDPAGVNYSQEVSSRSISADALASGVSSKEKAQSSTLRDLLSYGGREGDEEETPPRSLQNSIDELFCSSLLYVPPGAQLSSRTQPPAPKSDPLPEVANAKVFGLSMELLNKTQAIPSKRPDIPPVPHTPEIRIKEVNDFLPRLQRERAGSRKRDVVNQFTHLVQGTGLFRITGQMNVLYVADPNDLPSLRSKEWESGVRAVLDSRMEVFDDEQRLVLSVLPNAAPGVDWEPSLLGEVWVSQFLFNHLGSQGYRPLEHWNSPMRTKLDYEPPTKDFDEDGMPFEVPDNAGVLTRFLIGNGYDKAKRWEGEHPTYFIDVYTTAAKEVDDPVLIHPSKLEKARLYRIPVDPDERVKNVMIIIRIFNIDDKPTAAFYVDPWNVYARDGLALRIRNDMCEVSFKSSGTPIKLDNPERRIDVACHQLPPRTNGIFRSLRKRLQFLRGLNPPSPPKPPTPELDSIPDPVISYEWEPLPGAGKYIRILELQPLRGVGDLYGRLLPVSLENKSPRPEYEAISYAWGGKLAPFSLRLEEGRTMLLTASLYFGLRKILARGDDTGKNPIYVWAGAICIDQDEKKPEKGNQIRMLPEIFGAAKLVNAWLGEADEGSSNAMEALKDWGELLLKYKKESTSDNLPYTWQLPDLKVPVPPVDDPLWGHISRLLSRKWFNRLWIVQEVVIASDLQVICGNEAPVPWGTFYAGVYFCFLQEEWKQEKDLAIGDGTARANILKLGELRFDSHKHSKFQAQHKMLDLLLQCDHRAVTDPRDRMFGTISMATDANREELRPDYNLTAPQVTRKYARFFVEQGDAFELLYRTRFKAQESWPEQMRAADPALPSWIPDLTGGHYPKSLSTWNKSRFNAGDGRVEEPTARGTLDAEHLLIPGYIVETIRWVGSNASNSGEMKTYLREIFSAVDRAYEGRDAQEIENIKSRLPIGDAAQPTSGNATGEWYNSAPNATDAYRALRDFLSPKYQTATSGKTGMQRIQAAARTKSGLGQHEMLYRRLWPYINTAKDFADLFWPDFAVVCECEAKKSRGGEEQEPPRVGMVPTNALPGDVVVVFPGAAVPLVLREVRGQGTFQLIGECYIDGIMQGEAVRECRERKVDILNIKLA